MVHLLTLLFRSLCLPRKVNLRRPPLGIHIDDVGPQGLSAAERWMFGELWTDSCHCAFAVVLCLAETLKLGGGGKEQSG